MRKSLDLVGGGNCWTWCEGEIVGPFGRGKLLDLVEATFVLYINKTEVLIKRNNGQVHLQGCHPRQRDPDL